MKKYHKLVRDKIPEIIKADGEVPVYRILNDEEFRKELLIKVVEEAKELSATGSKGEEMIKEVGDVEEVIESIIKSFNLNKKKIKELKLKRKEGRGGFDKKIFLEAAK